MRKKYCLAVVPDIHMRVQLFDQAIELNKQGYEVVLLGDFVDNGPKPNDPGLLREILAFCRSSGSTPLIGNHDLPYLFPNRPEWRPKGYEPANADRISQVYDDHRDVLRYAYRVEQYLCSHAGLSKVFVHSLESRFGALEIDDLIALIHREKPEELYYRSPVNEGEDPFDGPMWLRLPQYHGAFQEQGITQVVGHSSQACIRMKHNLIMIDVQRPLIIEWEGQK